MIRALLDRTDKLLGRGKYSIAVPVMDGPLHPNHKLDHAAHLFDATDIDNLTLIGTDIWCSSGADLLRVSADGTPEVADTFDAPITCLAASGDGATAIGVDGGGIYIRGGAHNGRHIEKLGGNALKCATAVAFEDDHSLVITVGARDRVHAEWKRDLMAQGRTGEVWRVDLTNGTGKMLAGGLGFPYGICPTPNGLAVSEAWAHRIILIGESGQITPVLEDLPGYPARLAPDAAGGYVLAVFAPRNQLVEFVLREPEFLHAMTTQVPSDHWIAPKLMWGQGFKEPMQGAALKTMGIIKPWAPTWSYGLVVSLDDGFAPVASYHSRADGNRHGVTSVCTHGDKILVASKGAGVCVALSPNTVAEAN